MGRTAPGSYRNLYAGRCVILCPGPSAGRVDLSRVDCAIIGVNRSFELFPGPYVGYVCVDWNGMEEWDGPLRRLWDNGTAVFLRHDYRDGRTPDYGIPLSAGYQGAGEFETDIERAIWIAEAAPTALQVAGYLGFREILFIGLDLQKVAGRRYFDNHRRDSLADYSNQRAVLQQMAPGLASAGYRIVNLSDTTAEGFFEQGRFRDFFPGLGPK